MGAEGWRMYCVHWNTRKARLLRKSLADSRPATGRSWNPVLSGTRTQEGGHLPELRDALPAVARLLLQLLQPGQELSAGQAGVDAPQLQVHLPPVDRNATRHCTPSSSSPPSSPSPNMHCVSLSHHVATSSAV
ncbi:hypothetical protein EYF80_048043 [Liparis tanakae]|uniref:Uncharacterized protein n=1 Tax=Liparis tanakae TaxID=230148 RepID=A0A4Z2FKX4_9TELE|nr:hypothetical protein EYF80_048043 [Liparis tanakae]